MDLKLHKTNSAIRGTINLLGSKSISNRVLVIQAISGLKFSINNSSDSDDTAHLKEALHQINTGNTTTIDVGHAGTDMRFLTALLATKKGIYTLTGSERMQQRPIEELVNVLKQLGADITYKNKEGFPPLIINGKKIVGGTVCIKGNISSQFISALLLVAPYFENGLTLEIVTEIVSKPYIEMTIALMKIFGADVTWTNNIITVKYKPYGYSSDNYTVEGDWSSASYYYSLVALSERGTCLTLCGLKKYSLQADSICEEIYTGLGVQTQYTADGAIITKVIDYNPINLFEYDFKNCPDIAQTLVVTCFGLKQPFYFKGLETLKIKETDRIEALKTEALKLNINLNTTPNSIQFNFDESVEVPANISVSTYNDHRMAMSFAPLCLLNAEIKIQNASVVSKSYPLFWSDLEKIGITNFST